MMDRRDLRHAALGWLLVLLPCAAILTVTVTDARDAVRQRDQTAATARALEARLSARPLARSGPNGAPAAPASAFLTAATPGTATAALVGILTRRAAPLDLTLVSTHAPTVTGDGTVLLQATLTGQLGSLQDLLHDLETGVPFMFVDALAITPEGAPRPGSDPRLRATLTLRALWREPRL